MLQSRPATDSMAKMTKTQKDFPDTEVMRRWGKPWRLVEEQNLKNRLILRLVLGDSTVGAFVPFIQRLFMAVTRNI